jgi:hypothetical protein
MNSTGCGGSGGPGRYYCTTEAEHQTDMFPSRSHSRSLCHCHTPIHTQTEAHLLVSTDRSGRRVINCCLWLTCGTTTRTRGQPWIWLVVSLYRFASNDRWELMVAVSLPTAHNAEAKHGGAEWCAAVRLGGARRRSFTAGLKVGSAATVAHGFSLALLRQEAIRSGEEAS